MTTTGDFLNTFNTWKNNFILSKKPEISKVSATSLTVDNFLKLSTFDPVRKVDIVRERAEQLLVDAFLNCQSDTGLQLLGVSAPALHPDVKGFLTDSQKALLKNYSNLWLLQSIYYHKQSGGYKSLIKINNVESDMIALSPSPFFTRICMMFYIVALAELVPDILQYIYNSGTFNAKVRAQMLSASSITKYVQDTVTLLYQAQDNSVESEFDSFRFFELKAKLDLLQPNFLLSNDILSEYTYATIAFFITGNLSLDMIYPTLLFDSITDFIIQRNSANADNVFLPLINSLKTGCTGADGTLPTLTKKLSQFLFKFVQSQSQDFRTICSVAAVASQSNALPITQDYLSKPENSDFSSFASNANFIKFANALYDSCHVGTLLYSIQNYDNYEEFNQDNIYKGPGTYIYKFSDAATSKTLYSVMGEFIRDVSRTTLVDPKKIIAAFQKSFYTVLSDTVGMNLNRLLPAIYYLSKDYQMYQVFMSTADPSVIPTLTIPFNDLDQILVCQLGYFLKNQSFSGPSVVNYGLPSYGLAILSRINDQLSNTFSSLEVQTDQTTIPANDDDPIEIDPSEVATDLPSTTDSGETIDYFNVDFNSVQAEPQVDPILNYINSQANYKTTETDSSTLSSYELSGKYAKKALSNLFGLEEIDLSLPTTDDLTTTTDDSTTTTDNSTPVESTA